MIKQLHLNETQLAIIHETIEKTLPSSSKVFLFGSRTTAHHTERSDIDLLIDAQRALTIQEIEAINYAFMLSNLPQMVDIVDYHACEPTFIAEIQDSLISIR